MLNECILKSPLFLIYLIIMIKFSTHISQFALVVVTSLTFCQGSPVSQQGTPFKATSSNAVSSNAQKDVEFLSANEKCKLRFLLNCSLLLYTDVFEKDMTYILTFINKARSVIHPFTVSSFPI